MTVNNIVVVSDLHCGCRLGLCPDTGARMDDGGRYMPSRHQILIWEYWNYFWDSWVPSVCHGAPYSVVINGDTIDGVHHKSTTQISQNLGDQCQIAYDILAPIVAKATGFYMLRGTPAHSGEQGVQEEDLAKRLHAIPNEDGQHSRYELWKSFGAGRLAYFNHHIGTTGTAAYETTAVHKEMMEMFTESGRWGHQPADVCIRSHRHRMSETRIASKNGYAISFVTAGWQLKTPFAYRIAGARQSAPQVGGSIIRQGDEELHTRHWVKEAGRTRIE